MILLSAHGILESLVSSSYDTRKWSKIENLENLENFNIFCFSVFCYRHIPMSSGAILEHPDA